MITWQYYPKSDATPEHLVEIVEVFKQHSQHIDSSKLTLTSNNVLLILRESLQRANYKVEKGNKLEDKIKVAVLFGRDGRLDKSFHVDAFQEETGTVVEIEAGRAVDNYQFLKDLFEACMMFNAQYLVIAVRKIYGNQADFETVNTYFDTLFTSGRLKLPLKGILLIGY
jgi:hypothetical protein